PEWGGGLNSPESGPGSAERDFVQLPRRTQIGRLRRLAAAALTAYDLPAPRLTLLAHLFNTTFRVDSADGQRYVLRIHRAGTPTVASVGAELAWLAALRRDTSLEVPAPVPTRSGALLTVAAVPGVVQPHICVLFRWLPGRLRRRGLTPQQMERVGVAMAQLQNHARGWQRPPDFARGRVDWPIERARHLADPFAPQIVATIQTLVTDTLSATEAAQVTAALERLRATEQALAQEPDTFGLLHADLHYGNLLFARDTLRVIDFDDCGFGPWLYDPAVMLSAILEWPNYAVLRAALLAGYRSVRPLTPEHEAHLDTFIALRRLQDGLWALEYRKHPALGDDWAAEARRSLAPLPTLLAGSDVVRV
ncbi:MAG: phosphotransferase, partial [Chloroflexota bacterium]|nr:phosphotransferase [Chloroflexota bacterium]